MRKARLLVTAVGGDIGQSVIKCLRESRLGAYIVGCDMDNYAAGQSDCDRFYLCPPADRPQEYKNFLLHIIRKEKIDRVLPISEPEIAFYNSRRKLFADLRAKFLVNEKHVVDTFMDKYKTVEFFKANGFPYPETFLPSEYSNQLGFPLIIKKRRGRGSRGLATVRSKGELKFHLSRNEDVIIQEYLPGKMGEYTTGLFGDGRNMRSISFRRRLGYGGLSNVAELVYDKKLSALSMSIGEALRLRGSINIQLRLTERGYIPFEINPRFSSTVYFRHFFGFKDVTWWLGMLEGKTLRYKPKYKSGVGVRKLTEVFYDLKEMRRADAD